eukprot:667868-Prymnesium_polylepis.1
MLSSARHRAGALDVGKLFTARAFALTTAERVFTHRPAPKDRTAHGWLRGEIQHWPEPPTILRRARYRLEMRSTS